MNTQKYCPKTPTIPGFLTLGLLAKGDLSRVYLARDLVRKRRVAIKVYPAQTEGLNYSSNFKEEVRILESLQHIHIVTLYDKGELADGRLYLVMEYLEGGNLHDRIHGRMDEVHALLILTHLIHTLQFIHHRGIVHGDIKPANILFRRDHSLVLTDFGSNRDLANLVYAHPDYASPEQLRGKAIDWRTDLYSAGIVFVEMLTGKNPYRGGKILRPPRFNDHFAQFQPLVNKMLAPVVKDRFSSMHECTDHLTRLMNTMSAENVPVLFNFGNSNAADTKPEPELEPQLQPQQKIQA